MEEPQSCTQPRNPSWDQDGLGINEHGALVFRDGDTFYTTSFDKCVELLREYPILLSKLSSAEHRLKSREPHSFIPAAIEELEKRAAKANALRGEGGAGNVMWGQAQAYRDAASLLREIFPA